MARITYNINYKKNDGKIFSAQELIDLYLYGVRIKSKDGSQLSDETILMYINSAVQEIEKYLGIKIIKQFVEETVDYYREDYANKNFPKIKTTYFVNEPLSMIGQLGTSSQIKYPPKWLISKSSNKELYRKTISIVPVASDPVTMESGDLLLTGFYSQVGTLRYKDIPSYFNVQYITGFNEIPYDILNVIGKLAAIGLFNIAGDLILGAGVASMSLGIDGLSQSISSTSSATNSGYGARIIQYKKEIEDSLKRLKLNYRTINLTVL